MLGIGTDFVGSLRIPSFFTGIFAHKTTAGIAFRIYTYLLGYMYVYTYISTRLFLCRYHSSRWTFLSS